MTNTVLTNHQTPFKIQKLYTKQEIREIIFDTKRQMIEDAKKSHDDLSKEEIESVTCFAWHVINKLTYEQASE